MSGDRVRVRVDAEACIGSGQCEMLEPDTFLVDDDAAISSVTGEGLLSRDRATVVMERCPVRAISIAGER